VCSLLEKGEEEEEQVEDVEVDGDSSEDVLVFRDPEDNAGGVKEEVADKDKDTEDAVELVHPFVVDVKDPEPHAPERPEEHQAQDAEEEGTEEAKVSLGEEAVAKHRDDDEEGDDGSFDNLIEIDVRAGDRDDVPCAEREADEEEDVEAAFLAEAEEGDEEDEFKDSGGDVKTETEALVDVDGITDTLRVDDRRADEGDEEELEGNDGIDLGHESVAVVGSHQSHHKRLVSSMVVVMVSVDIS